MHVQATMNVAPRLDYAALAVCRGLGREAVSHVAAMSSVRRLAPGEALFNEGDRTESIYEVLSGMLRIYKLLPDGRRQITGFLSAGHLVGLAHRNHCLYTVDAVTPVTLCRYPLAHFDRLVDQVPGFARRLLAVTSDELRAAQDQMLLLGRKTAEEKIASFLLMMAKRQKSDETVQLSMTRSDIADYLGLTTETVSRTLTKLKSHGTIALPAYGRVELTDREQLEELAAGELAAAA
jgi:CRP/FNR family transcriptional regulator